MNTFKDKEWTETELQKIQDELADLVNEYFPKIKPNGPNKGRGEAYVIVGLALAKFRSLLSDQKKQMTEVLEGMKIMEFDNGRMLQDGTCAGCGKWLGRDDAFTCVCDIRNEIVSDIINEISK